MTANCHIETWTGPWDRMRTSVKMGNANKICSLANSIVPINVHKHPMGCKMVMTGKQSNGCTGTLCTSFATLL